MMTPTSFTIIVATLLVSLSFSSALTTTLSSKYFPHVCCTFGSRADGDFLSMIAATEESTAHDTLWLMTSFFGSMVDTSQDRFYALCKPQSDEFIHVHCPLRDLGAAWDATTALLFWRNQRERSTQGTFDHSKLRQCEELLVNAIHGTIQAYSTSYTTLPNNAGLSLDASLLLEPPNIAHSAFLVLVTSGALQLSLFHDTSNNIPPVSDLIRGILSQQRKDGAFRIEFGSDDVYRGMEFYAGEAMVALMEVLYEQSLASSTKQAILPAMERAFIFYSNHYREENVDTNYNIWQVQAFARLFYVLHHRNTKEGYSREQATLVANYVLELCEDIVKSISWKELARGRSFYPNLQTVEIACGLDALAQGIHVASVQSRDEQDALFRRNAQNAVDFVEWIQELVPPESAGNGGLGYGGVQVFEQRLDVTGHALSALVKLGMST